MRKRLNNVHFDAVFSSPMSRALDTCNDPDAIVDPNLVEWNYGQYEGITTKEIKEKNPDWNIFIDGAPNGEPIHDVSYRADAFLKRAAQYDGNVVIFSHGHFIRVLTSRYLGLEASFGRFLQLSVASLSILGKEHNSPAIALSNDTHHLE